MQVTKSVRALKLPFQVPLAPGRTLDRFVYTYLVKGASANVLVDCGVRGSTPAILDWAQRDGPVSTAVVTHPHPDHIGGLKSFQSATGCRVAAHPDAVAWTTDVDRQFRERPVPGFHTLVEGSLPRVDVLLREGDELPLDGLALRAIETPGHAPGHIALVIEAEGILIAGDSVPMPGQMPIYDDAAASLASLGKLQRVKGARLLLPSWADPNPAVAPGPQLEAGIAWIRAVHAAALKGRDATRSTDPTEVGRFVCQELGVPPTALNPLFFRTVAAHLRAADSGAL